MRIRECPIKCQRVIMPFRLPELYLNGNRFREALLLIRCFVFVVVVVNLRDFVYLFPKTRSLGSTLLFPAADEFSVEKFINWSTHCCALAVLLSKELEFWLVFSSPLSFVRLFSVAKWFDTFNKFVSPLLLLFDRVGVLGNLEFLLKGSFSDMSDWFYFRMICIKA